MCLLKEQEKKISMGLFIYLLGAFFGCYLSYKKYYPEIQSRTSYDTWVDTSGFWKIVGITISWPIFVPLALMWRLLDYFFNKLTKKD
jgi:hypothetical protein